MKVALAFWGITRSLKYTIDSIRKNILDSFESHADYTIFMHTYTLNTYTNIRSGEHQEIVDSEEYKLLNPDFVEIDEQDTIKAQLNLPEYRTHPDPWHTSYNSVDNFILSMYSKSRVVNMITNTDVKYDYIIFLRPDVKYLVPFDLKFLDLVDNNSICIPNFHLHGPYKFNDRFCICNMRTYMKYGSIFSLLLDISKKERLHSETILGRLMAEYSLNVRRIPFTFLRVRCNGHTEPDST